MIFAVVSALAADVAMNEGLDIDICVNFGKYTYVNAHVLVFGDDNSTQIEDGMKIGVDRSSIDQTLLTESECRNKKVQLVDLAYNQIITKLKNGEIQAAILNSDEIIERKLDIKYYPLRNTDKTTKATEAVIVVSKDNFGLKNLFASLIERERVVNYQQQVVAGDIIPNY
jgi:ABC-type amino acid transport substrate-binding protein